MNVKKTLLVMTGVFLGAGCGPGIENIEQSDSRSTGTTTGSQTSTTVEVIESTGTEYSIDTLRPWFGHYHLEGGLNPPLDVESAFTMMYNFEFREDGTFTYEGWWCENDEPATGTYQWTQTGPYTIHVENLHEGVYLPDQDGGVEFFMGEDCTTIHPTTPLSNEVLVRGRTCWVTRDCDTMLRRTEITLCDGPEGAECSP